ncbi:protein of unknown function [Serratia sp. Tan611]|nr:protein of unknown function [Serratia sp. Tan611]
MIIGIETSIANNSAILLIKLFLLYPVIIPRHTRAGHSAALPAAGHGLLRNRCPVAVLV